MADDMFPAPAPTRSDDQILPFAVWVPIGKSNHVLDLQKRQKNPIFQIAVDILQNTNFFRAFTATASMDEDWFTLDENLLKETLEITPIDQAHPFMSPPLGDAIMDFVNELGYPKVIHFVSSMAMNHLYQPWREILSMVNQCLTVPLRRTRKTKLRSASPFHLAEEDLKLSNLKFVSKGKIDEVFGMPIPNELILNNIRNASYYNAYLEMVTKHDQKVAAKKEGKKKSASTKQPKPKPAIEKSSKPAPASKPKVTKEKPSKASTAKPPKPKPTKEKSTKATPLQKAGKGKVAKVRNVKSSFQLVDEPDEEPAHSEPEPEPEQEGAGEEYDMKRAIQMSLESFQAQGHAHVRGEAPRTNSYSKQNSTTDEASTGTLYITHWKTPSAISFVTLRLRKMLKQRNRKKSRKRWWNLIKTSSIRPWQTLVVSTSTRAGPSKLNRDSIINEEFEDAYAIGDQFINDKSTDDEPGKLNVEAEVVSMVTVPIYQASSSVPPLLTPLAERVAALEKKLSDLEQIKKNLDNTTRNLRSRVYTLKLRDLPHKINKAVHENVKEAVQIALQAPLRDRVKDLPEEDMKDMLHQRMFESGTYKSLPEHIALYETLKASMSRAQRDEFLAEKEKSRKRRRDDQDLPPPLPDSDLGKRRRHDTGASGSSQPPAPQSPAWKKSDTRDALSSSSKPKWLKPIPDDERPATLEPAWVSPTSHIPDAENNWANALASTYQALAENSLLEKTRDMRTFMNWYCQKMGKTELTQADLEGQAYEVVKPFYPDVVHLQFQMEDKGSGQAFSISKMKVARYHDFGLEILVPEHIADHREYTIAKKDFKNLYPSDFEDLNLLLLQSHLNHLPGSDIRMLSTAVKLWTRNLMIRERVEDFQLDIESYQK
ncbi:hypothetical protein Tco_0854415 [Tanacetum coccineum]